MSRPHIGLLIAYGPEVRAFLHSGLAARLAERYDVTVIARLAHAGVFEVLQPVRVAQMPSADEGRLLTKLRSWAARSQTEWLRTRGRTTWAHYLAGGAGANGKAKSALSLTKLARLPGVTRGLAGVERGLGRACGTVPEWRRLFDDRRLDGVLASAYASPHLLPALQTAANLGLKTVVATNSWKDVYTTTHVAVVPDRLLVWSERAARDLLSANPHLPARRVAVVPSLHLEPFLNPPPVLAREEFCRQAGLDPARPYLCYSAASPAAVLNEELIVRHLWDAIERGAIPGRPQVLVRLNPMEDGSRFQALATRGGLVIQKPQWEWNRAQDWCCALPADVRGWVACAWHAALNVSIASTVTLEFAALNRPVVNVCFDLPAPLPPATSNRRFWDAEFYSEIRERQLAVPADSPEALVRCVAQWLATRADPERAPTPPPVVSPVERVLDILADAIPA